MVINVLLWRLYFYFYYFQLVKEQKGRITELSKSKQEQLYDYKVSLYVQYT